MTTEERKQLAEVSIPLVVLARQIEVKPYKEITGDLQDEIVKARDIILDLLFPQNKELKSSGN